MLAFWTQTAQTFIKEENNQIFRCTLELHILIMKKFRTWVCVNAETQVNYWYLCPLVSVKVNLGKGYHIILLCTFLFVTMCSAHLQFLIVHSPSFIYIKPVTKDRLSWFASVVHMCTCLCCGNTATPKQIPVVSIGKLLEPWFCHVWCVYVVCCNFAPVSVYFLSGVPPMCLFALPYVLHLCLIVVPLRF